MTFRNEDNSIASPACECSGNPNSVNVQMTNVPADLLYVSHSPAYYTIVEVNAVSLLKHRCLDGSQLGVDGWAAHVKVVVV